jgi:hypothetical protein
MHRISSKFLQKRSALFLAKPARHNMMLMFWVLALCRLIAIFSPKAIFRAGDGDSMFLRNAGIYLQVYMVPKPGRTTTFILTAMQTSNLTRQNMSSVQVISFIMKQTQF